MQTQKTLTAWIIFIILGLLLGMYSMAQSLNFGFALLVLLGTWGLQWQVTQLQQRLQRLEQQLEHQFEKPLEQRQPDWSAFTLPHNDITLWMLPLALAVLLSVAVYWQHHLGMLLSAVAWLSYFVWSLWELQQRIAWLEQGQFEQNQFQQKASQQKQLSQSMAHSSLCNSTEAVPKAQHEEATAVIQPQSTQDSAVNAKDPLPAWMQQHGGSKSEAPSANIAAASHVQSNSRTYSTAQAGTASQSTEWFAIAQQWLLKGNPILRVAVLLILVGVVLLLRFASEHWQLSLATKLSMIAASGAIATFVAYRLRVHNAVVSVAVQGVGLAVIFLTLIFAQQNQLLSSLLWSSVVMTVLLALTILLSLKQSSLYLAILALGMAYLAPLLIPEHHPDALLIFAYYLLINVAVAVINHVKGWKILNHLAFVASMLLAGGIILDDAQTARYVYLDALLWLHMALFIFVSIRYSQLMLQQQNLRKLDNAALLDVGLIFAVPILGFSLHAYLMQDDVWGLTLGATVLAGVYAGLVWWIRRCHPELALLSTSFLILTMVFVALIFPLAQGAHWSTIGWVVQGSALVVWGVAQRNRLSRYMGVLLLLLSTVTLLGQVWSEKLSPNLSIAIYATALFIAAGALLKYDATQQRYFSASVFSALFLSLALYAGAWLSVQILPVDVLGLNVYLAAATGLLGMFSLWMRYRAAISWQHSHLGLAGLLLLLHFSELLRSGVLYLGHWPQASQQYAFLATALLLTALLLFAQRMLHLGATMQQLWAGLTLLALGSIGIGFIADWAIIPMAIGPIVYTLFTFRSWQHHQMLQQPTVWVVALLWLFFNTLHLQNSTPWYALPVVNPNDALSLVVLAGVMQLIFQAKPTPDTQAQVFLKIISLLLALWVISFVLIRALHVYADIPLQAMALWQSGVVQLSLTVLWMLLALLLTTYASRNQIREFWYVGAALLGLVVAKLILFDLAQTATLTRVVSFMAAGGFMLVIAYVAPLPPPREHVSHLDPLAKTNDP